MGKMKTHEEFVQQLYNINKEIKVTGIYSGANNRIEVQCLKCNHIWKPSASSLVNMKTGCPKCSGLLKDVNDFKKEMFELVGDEYEIVGDYKNRTTNIEIKHNVCGYIFKATPTAFVSNGVRCTNKDCIHKRISDAVSKDNKIKKFFNNNTEYLLLNNEKNIMWRSTLHLQHITCGTTFDISADGFFSKGKSGGKISKCPTCRKIQMKQKMSKTTEQFVQEMFDVNKNILIMSDYINSEKHVLSKCLICKHEWWSSPNNLLSGCGCPKCRKSHGEIMIINYLEENNISYISPKTYDGLIGVGGRNLSYDFYLPDYNILIEFQGNFHDGTAHQQSEEDFKIQQEHDKRKREYARLHNINLLEIWYWEAKDQDDINDIVEEYIHDCVYGVDDKYYTN